jgi:choline transport protein
MYIGLDGAMHMAEECIAPERVIPRTIMAAVGIGFTTGFLYTVAQLYAITDITEVMTTTQ